MIYMYVLLVFDTYYPSGSDDIKATWPSQLCLEQEIQRAYEILDTLDGYEDNAELIQISTENFGEWKVVMSSHRESSKEPWV